MSADQVESGSRMITRRGAILGSAGLAAVALAAPAASAGEFAYRGWRFNTDAASRDLPADLVASFKAQIDMVEGLPVKAEALAFFHTVPCIIDLTTAGGPGAYSAPKRRMELSTTPQPHDNPVLLHELLHAYHHQVLPNGFRNAKVRGFHDAAKAAALFPPNAYLMKDHIEFFAMCASVVLWGRAARPPYERANVKTKAPRLYEFVVSEFAFTGG